MSQEFINGILIGAGTTAFGFVLSMLWDIWKSRQERIKLQNSLRRLLFDELESNSGIIRRNKLLLNQEKEYLSQGKSFVNALDVPKADFWEVFKFNYDYTVFSEEQVKIIKEIYAKVHSIIANIESRENYRISNGAMSNFNTHMLIYDGILLGLLEDFESLYTKSGFANKK